VKKGNKNSYKLTKNCRPSNQTAFSVGLDTEDLWNAVSGDVSISSEGD